jgi:hypothetical protein
LLKPLAKVKITQSKKSESEVPYVSIVILNYNGKRYLDARLDSINKISYSKDKYEAIMIDNWKD